MLPWHMNRIFFIIYIPLYSVITVLFGSKPNFFDFQNLQIFTSLRIYTIKWCKNGVKLNSIFARELVL